MRFICTAIDWLNPLIYTVGLAVGLWGYRQTKAKGFLVITVYFALVVCTLVAAPHINRVIQAKTTILDGNRSQGR